MTNTASGSWGVPLVAAVVVLGILLCPSGKAMGMNFGPATIRDRSDLYMHGVEMPVVDQVAVRIPVWRGRG